MLVTFGFNLTNRGTFIFPFIALTTELVRFLSIPMLETSACGHEMLISIALAPAFSAFKATSI